MTPGRSLSFRVESREGTRSLEVPVSHVILGGWSGRDKAAVEAHIAELKEHGVPPPPSTPAFYPVSVDRLSQRDAIQVSGPNSSGEVEYFVVMAEGALYVGLGSDQTDRKLEAHSITLSKQICEKVLAPVLWPVAEVADHWDELVLRADAQFGGERQRYQEAALATMLGPQELIDAHWQPGAALPAGALLFSGTVPAIGGVRPMDRFEMCLEDPILGRSIDHAYDIEVLAVPA